MTSFFTHKFRERSPLEIVGIVIFGAIFIAGLIVLLGFVIMWLWNWLMPDIFGFPALTYWQAVGLFALLKILFCGFGGGSKSSSKDSEDHDKKGSKTDFSKWKYYDKFWKEEGDEYYKQYVERQLNQADEDTAASE